MTAIAVPRLRWLPRALFAVTAASLGLSFVALTAGFVFHETEHETGIPLGSITEEPRLVAVDGYAAVVLKVDRSARAYVPVDARGDPLMYCEGTFGPGAFTTRYAWTQYALEGWKLGGPGPRGLDVYDTTIRDHALVIHVHRVLRNSSNGPDTPVVKWNNRLSLYSGYCPPPGEIDRITRSG